MATYGGEIRRKNILLLLQQQRHNFEYAPSFYANKIIIRMTDPSRIFVSIHLLKRQISVKLVKAIESRGLGIVRRTACVHETCMNVRTFSNER